MIDKQPPQPMREMTAEEIAERDQRIIEHLALLIVASAYGLNYTSAIEMAKWMTAAAKRSGWFLYV